MREETLRGILLDSGAQTSAITADALWLRVGVDRLPAHINSGWKLHVSCLPSTLASTLAVVVPEILARGMAFKVARDAEVVERLNAGEFGLTQVGKALTVYAVEEGALASLGAAMRARLLGLRTAPLAPEVPNEPALFHDVPLYFRFGPLDGGERLDALGRKRRRLVHPQFGEIDDTEVGGSAEGIVPEHLPRRPAQDHLQFLRDRFFMVRLEQVTAKGAVVAALPRETPRRGLRLIKTARRGACSDVLGRDALWAAQREVAWLRRLAGVRGFVEPGIIVAGPRALAQVRPYLDGDTLWTHWTAPGARGAGQQWLCAHLRALAGTVRGAHARGVLLRDISPGNVLIAEGRPWFVDCELAHGTGEDAPPYRRGTFGFFDPLAASGAPPTRAGDHYALLALAFMVQTGAQAGWWKRGLHDAIPGVALALNDVLGRLGTDTFWNALHGALENVTVPSYALEPCDPVEAWLPRLAAQLRDSLGTPADPDAHNVYHGSAGIYLLIREMAGDNGNSLSAAESEALADAWRACGERVAHIPGLYFGISGMALALAALGMDVGRADWIQESLTLLRRACAGDSQVPDLCHGLAGALYAATRAARLTDEKEFHRIAAQLADRLRESARADAQGAYWAWPEHEEFGGLSGSSGFGFAHGSAGIAYALMLWGDVSGDAACARLGAAAAGRIAQQARPVPEAEQDGAVWWPVDQEDLTCWNAWCHGTPGIVKCLSLARRLGLWEDAAGLLPRALSGMAVCNNGEPGLCHGVASRLDAWCDARTAGVAAADENAARRDAAILNALDPDWIERLPGVNARGLMTGAAGILRTLARYHNRIQRELLP